MDTLIGAPVIDMNSEENKGKFLIMDMGVNGAREFKAKYKNAIFLYVIPPTKERLLSQMEDRDISRVVRSQRQLPNALEVCDWLIVNDDIEETVSQVQRIMHSLKEYGERVYSLDFDTMKFLYSKNFHNKENVKFLKEFYGKEISKGLDPL